MARCWWLSNVVCVAVLFLGGFADVCWADTYCQLTVCQSEDDFDLKLEGEYDLQLASPWRMELSAVIPSAVTSDDEARASLALSWTGDDWRWTGTACLTYPASGADGSLRLRGSYAHADWSGAATLYWEQELEGDDGEASLSGYVARSFGRHWRLSLAQEIADVTSYDGQNHYRRYETEASATLYLTQRWYRLALGGHAHQSDDPIDDSRTLYSEFAWRLGLKEGWSLSGEFRLDESEEAVGSAAGRSLSLALIRRAPIGLKLQGAYAADDSGDEVRGGLTVLGKTGSFFWRAGAACAVELSGDVWEAWPFVVFGWRGPVWETAIGLAPSGEYAVNSRHGYWAAVTYSF